MTDTTAEVSLLDEFEREARKDPKRAIALLFWKARHTNPEMSVQINEKDLTGLAACVEYLGVEPEVRITRPRGTPPRAPIPAHGEHHAIPGSSGTPDKPFVVVQLVDAKGDAFVPIENNEDDARLRDQTRARSRLKDRAPFIADQILAELQAGSFTDGTLKEAAQILRDLAKAVP